MRLHYIQGLDLDGHPILKLGQVFMEWRALPYGERGDPKLSPQRLFIQCFDLRRGGHYYWVQSTRVIVTVGENRQKRIYNTRVTIEIYS